MVAALAAVLTTHVCELTMQGPPGSAYRVSEHPLAHPHGSAPYDSEAPKRLASTCTARIVHAGTKLPDGIAVRPRNGPGRPAGSPRASQTAFDRRAAAGVQPPDLLSAMLMRTSRTTPQARSSSVSVPMGIWAGLNRVEAATYLDLNVVLSGFQKRILARDGELPAASEAA